MNEKHYEKKYKIVPSKIDKNVYTILRRKHFFSEYDLVALLVIIPGDSYTIYPFSSIPADELTFLKDYSRKITGIADKKTVVHVIYPDE